MDFEPVFRRYDIRGDHPGEIDGEFAERLGRSVGTFVVEEGGEKVAVCMDTKESSPGLKRRLVKGIISTGIEVRDAGTGPTDYAALAAVENSCHAVQVTSSHLPLDTAGFKLIYPEGNGFTNDDLDKTEGIFRSQEFRTGEAGTQDIEEKMHRLYLDRAERFVREKAGEGSGEIAVECMGGTAAEFLPELLQRLGFDVEKLDTPIDPPKPEPASLEHVDAERALACDMDADRVAYRDTSQELPGPDHERNGWIDGDRLFAALARMLAPGKIVASVDTSPMVEESTDAEIEYTRVGDPFVISRTLETGAELSGEPNGHYCFPEFVPYNSGTVAAALFAVATPDFGELPEYHSVNSSVESDDREKSMERLERLVDQSGHEVLSRVDGVKFTHGEAQVLVRPSGTEQRLRIYAHSRRYTEAVGAADRVESWLRNE